MKKYIVILLISMSLFALGACGSVGNVGGKSNGIKWLVEPKYENIGFFRNGYCKVCIEDKWGCIDKSGKEIIPCKYQYLDYFENGVAMVAYNNGFGVRNGVIDITDKEIIPFEYNDIIIRDTYIIATKGDVEKYFDLAGKEIAEKPNADKNSQDEIISAEYKKTQSYYSDMLPQIENKLGQKIQWIRPCRSSHTYNPFFSDNYAIFRADNEKQGVVSKDGGIFIEPTYFRLEPVFEETVTKNELVGFTILKEGENDRAYEDRKYGFISLDKKIVEPQFDNYYTDGFQEGLMVVMLNSKIGYIGKDGRIIEPKYDYISGNHLSSYVFQEGRAIIENENQKRYGVIDMDGNEVVPPKYMLIKKYSEGLAVVVNDENRFGYIDKSGKEVIAPQFAEALIFYEGFASVRVKDEETYDSKWGIIINPLDK